MNTEYFEKLVAWQAEKPNHRTIQIEFRPPPDNVKIWAYDVKLMEGQFVNEPDIPNLEAKAEKAARAEYERLKAKFEKEGGEI